MDDELNAAFPGGESTMSSLRSARNKRTVGIPTRLVHQLEHAVIPRRTWDTVSFRAGHDRRAFAYLSVKLSRIVLAALVVLLVAPAAVEAHSGIQSYVYVSLFDDGVEGRVEYPIADLAEVLGIELPDRPSTIDDLSDSGRSAIVDYTRDHLEMGDDDGPWDLQFDGSVGYLDAGVGYVLVPFDVAEDFDDVPRRWTVTYDGVIESKPERDALFLIEDDWRTATFRNEGEHLLGFSIGNETQLIELDSSSATESLREVARRGTVSVEKSAMLLAAVVAVLAAAVLARGRRSTPAESTGRGATNWRQTVTDVGVRIGLVVVGQSLSLWVLGLSGVDVGSRSVMALGALGVLAAAATWWAGDTAARVGALIAGVLSGVWVGATFVGQELDRSAQIRSLLAFDVGASLMVVLVTLFLLPMVLVVQRSRHGAAIGALAVSVIAAAGIVWLVESSLGLRFRLRSAEIRVADAVTSPFVVGVVTVVVAAVVLWHETSRSNEASSIHDESQPDSSEPIEVR